MCWEERYTQRRTASSSRIFRRALRARRRRVSFFTLICYALLLRSFFTTDYFVRVTYTLVLVRLGTTEGVNFSSHLTNHLLIDTLDQDSVLAGTLSGNALRQFIVHRVREAESQRQHVTFGLRLVTDADQLELALEALADTEHHVVHQRASGTGHGASLLITITASETQLARILDDFNGRMNVQFQSALCALHRKLLAGHLDFDASGQLDGVLSNARHAYPPLRTQCRALRRRHQQRGPHDQSSHPCWWTRSKHPDRRVLSATDRRICTGEGQDGLRASALR